MKVKLLLSALFFCCLHLNSQNSLVFKAADVAVNAGSQFTVDITVKNFTQVSSFSFSLNWDETQITFDTITNMNASLPVISTNFNTTIVSTGLLGVSWFDPAGLEKSLSDNTVLFKIKFKAALTPGSTLIQFTDEISPIVAENSLGLIPLTTIPGTIIIQGVSSTVEKISWGAISLYPNPTKDWIHFKYELEKVSPLTLELSDSKGSILAKQAYEQAMNGETKIDLANFPSGNYRIRIVTNEGAVSKLISIVK